MSEERASGPMDAQEDHSIVAAQREEIARLGGQLREHRLRMALAVESVGGGVWEHDAASNEATVSPLVKGIIGLDAAAPDALAQWAERVHPDDVERLKRSHEDVLAGRSDLHAAEYRLRARDGSWRWIQTRGRLLRDEHGRPLRMIGLDLDITERKRVETALAEREVRIRDFAESASDWFWETDAAHRFIFFSERLTELTGIRPEDVLGKRRDEVLADTDPSSDLDAHLADLAAHRPFRSFAYWTDTPTGRRCFSISGKPVFDEAGDFRGYRGTGSDITQRKRADAALRESEERFAAIFKQSTAGISQCDLSGRFVLVNECYCQIVGRQAEELYRLRMQDITHPDDLPGNAALFERMVREGEDFVVEKRYVRPDGSHVWVSNSVSLVVDRDGRPQYAVAVGIEVTARKEAQAERERLLARLRESETRMRLAFAAANASPWSWERETDVLALSRWTRRRLDLPAEGTVTWAAFVERFVHPDDRERARREFAQVAAGTGRFEGEYRVVLPHGAARWYAVRGRPVEEAPGVSNGATGVLLDITERKRAAEELWARERELRLIADSLPGVVARFDLEERYLFANATYGEWFDMKPEEVLGRNLREVIGEAGYRVAAPFYARARRGEQVTFENGVTRPGRPPRDILVTLVPDRDQAGAVRGCYALATDITERKRAEKERELLMRELEHRVKNVLATVQAVVTQTLPRGAAAEALRARIGALAQAQDVLAAGRWAEADLRALIEGELAPYGEPGRAALSGGEVRLPSGDAQALALVLHELATNAAKYGALSVPEGRVEVRWEVVNGADRRRLRLIWTESGGPSVASPSRRGFGSKLIERVVVSGLDGQARLDFRPQGLRCTLAIPLPESGQAKPN